MPLRTTGAPAPVYVSSNAGSSASADVVLPDDFTERIRRLPPYTLVHIPVAQRIKIAIATAECFEGIAADLMKGWGLLEEGRSKLLFSCIPDGAHVPREVAIRISLLSSRRYADLLNRVEIHMVNKRKTNGRRRKGKRKLVEDDFESNPQRERAINAVREGAYKKAVVTVSDDFLPLSSEDNRYWADKLHPRSSNPSEACSRNDAA